MNSDWIANFENWINSNQTLTSYIAAVTSFLAVIGLPTIVSMAKTLANANENRSYRSVTLVRVFFLISFLFAVLGVMLNSATQDQAYNEKLAKCERMSDVRALAVERKAELDERKSKIESLKATAEAKVGEFSKVPASKKMKKAKKEAAERTSAAE